MAGPGDAAAVPVPELARAPAARRPSKGGKGGKEGDARRSFIELASPRQTRGLFSMGEALPPLVIPGVPGSLPALTFERRWGRALMLPPLGLPWSPEWSQPQGKRLPPLARPGFAGLATPAAPSLAASLWLCGWKELAGGCGCALIWGTSMSFMPLRVLPSLAARRAPLPAWASCSSSRVDLPPSLLARMRLPGSAGLLSVLGVAGLGTTFSARCFMAWTARVMLFSMILPVTVRNTMELAAVLWALVWVVISCPPCTVCVASGSLFSCNVTEAVWSVGRHDQLARFCSSLLLIASRVTDGRFDHVKAHGGNPFNGLADCLAKRAAGGVDAPLPAEVVSLFHCCDSVTWEWLHGAPPDVRAAYLPLRGGCFIFDEVRSSVSPSCLVKDSAGGDVGCVRGTDVIACVSFGSSMFAPLAVVVCVASLLLAARPSSGGRCANLA